MAQTAATGTISTGTRPPGSARVMAEAIARLGGTFSEGMDAGDRAILTVWEARELLGRCITESGYWINSEGSPDDYLTYARAGYLSDAESVFGRQHVEADAQKRTYFIGKKTRLHPGRFEFTMLKGGRGVLQRVSA